MQNPKKAIESHLRETVNDPDAYEPIAFGALDTLSYPNPGEAGVKKFLMSHSFRSTDMQGVKIVLTKDFILLQDPKGKFLVTGVQEPK
jgi:hypothetical protein